MPENQYEKLRNEIRGTGITINELIEKLGIAKSTFFSRLKSAYPDQEIVQKVRKAAGLGEPTPEADIEMQSSKDEIIKIQALTIQELIRDAREQHKKLVNDLAELKESTFTQISGLSKYIADIDGDVHEIKEKIGKPKISSGKPADNGKR